MVKPGLQKLPWDAFDAICAWSRGVVKQYGGRVKRRAFVCGEGGRGEGRRSTQGSVAAFHPQPIRFDSMSCLRSICWRNSSSHFNKILKNSADFYAFPMAPWSVWTLPFVLVANNCFSKQCDRSFTHHLGCCVFDVGSAGSNQTAAIELMLN
jgi:hypothetical protein